MKTQIRLTSLLVSIVLMVSFTACGGNTKPTDSSSTSSSQNDSSVEGTTSQGASDTTAVSGDTSSTNGQSNTSGGKTNASSNAGSNSSGTTKTQSSTDQAFINSLKGLTLTINDPWEGAKPGNPIKDREMAIDKEVGQKYGVTIVRKPMSTDAVAAAITAGNKDSVGQIVRFKAEQFADWYGKNVFASLNDAVKKSGVDFNAKWYDPATNKFFTVNGQQVAWTGGTIDTNVVFYNKRLLQLANLTTEPTTLYKNGTWTYEKLAQYAKAGKKMNGSTVTTWGLESFEQISFMNNLVLSNGGRMVKMSNGKPVLNMQDSKTKVGMDWFHKLIVEDKTAYIPVNWDQSFKDFVNGKTMMLVSGNNVFNNINSSGMKDAIGVVPFPKGPDASGYTVAYSGMYPQFIPKLYEADAAKYLFLIDQINQRSYKYWEDDFKNNYDTLLKGDSFTLYHNVAHDIVHTRKSIMDYMDVSGAKFIQGAFLPDGKETSMKQLVADIASGTLTPSASVDKYASAIQTQLNAKWKNIKSAS